MYNSEPLKEIRIPVSKDFKKKLIIVFNELRVIYRFEDDVLVLYQPEAKALLEFLKPINGFFEQLEKVVSE